MWAGFVQIAKENLEVKTNFIRVKYQQYKEHILGRPEFIV